MKMRMTTVDIAAEVQCLRRLIGFRAANVYDINPKTYIIKLARSSLVEGGEGEKALLLLESGIRFHATAFQRDKNQVPSGIALKLRKHMRTRRLENVRQLGSDRVVDFQFGVGESACHLLLELYAQGNILLTDAKYEVLTLLRSHRDDNKGLAMMARHVYPLDSIRPRQRTSREALEAALQNAKPGETLKSALAHTAGYGPALAEHCIIASGLQPASKVPGGEVFLSPEQLDALQEAFNKLEGWLDDAERTSNKGYIMLAKAPMQPSQRKNQDSPEDASAEEVYEEFTPLQLHQHAGRRFIEFDIFDAAMDEFFSKVETQKANAARRQQENQALSKLDKVRADQTKRAVALEKDAAAARRRAELIQFHSEEVDAAVELVRDPLDEGMDWGKITNLVKEKRKAGDAVAGLIHGLDLANKKITLLLADDIDDVSEEVKTTPVHKVEVDLYATAWANARALFGDKKQKDHKLAKTLESHEKAFKAVEKKTQQQLSQVKQVAAIQLIRKVHWFEKFHWFVSSDRYLVLSGRDAQQNEQLVKRYLRKGDVYVHADIHGASSCIIKNRFPDQPIPPITLSQAGAMTVCRSSAWDAKIVTSAWWVQADQVSKTAPTGEYLVTGSFMVRGKKNFLPPTALIMGFGFMFRLDESSIAAHLHDEANASVDDKAMADVASEAESEPVETDDEALEATNSDGEAATDSRSSEQLSNTQASLAKSVDPSTDAKEEPASASGDETAGNEALAAFMDSGLRLRPASSETAMDATASTSGDDDDDDDGMSTATQESQRNKPRLSAKQRRDMKRQKELQALGLPPQDEAPSTTNASNFDAASTISKDSSCKQEHAPRGKHGKLKKMKEKYADQDEEERALAMSLLQSDGKKEPKIKGKDNRGKGNTSTAAPPNASNMAEQATKPAPSLPTQQLLCYICKLPGHLAAACPTATVRPSSAADTPVGDGADDSTTATAADNADPESKGMSRRAKARAAQAEIAAILAEEGVMELTPEDKERLSEMDLLTGAPRQEDILMCAIPVCAPYDALQRFKYKVKLTPGSQRKGKAAKQALEVFIRSPDVLPREKELMRVVQEPELVQVMVGNVKVSTPGLTKVQNAKKGKGGKS
eukprot:jgi/Chlat1/3141/Chrsp21S03365